MVVGRSTLMGKQNFMRRITYFAPMLKSLAKYGQVWEQIKSALERENELYDFVPNAKDIWVRDFMPFQRHDGKFLVYCYNPDYLQGKNTRYITDCSEAFRAVCGNEMLALDFCAITDLILDGGNMIKCCDIEGCDCVIMTTKVLYENPGLSHREILNELESCLQAEVILIPWDAEEPYGHSDGMVRSIGRGKLLLNCYPELDQNLGKAVRKALGNRFEIQELSYGKEFRENSWCHLNYLELGNAVLVPVAGLASDRLAVEQIERRIGKIGIPINMSPIISGGGAMHCISWTMYANS